MKHAISNLVIEVTRRCNMACGHCLRGEAQNTNIDNDHIDALLEQVGGIGVVTFTGGEPSLNIEAISHFVEECLRREISIDSFYIATNGVVIPQAFVMECLKLYSMADEKDLCRVDVSNDYFHASEGNYNTELLAGLSFFGRKFDEENYDYNGGKGLITEGNGENFVGRMNSVCVIESLDDLMDTEIYLNCNGDIINGCDWSYDSQDDPKHKLCAVAGLSDFIEGLED